MLCRVIIGIMKVSILVMSGIVMRGGVVFLFVMGVMFYWRKRRWGCIHDLRDAMHNVQQACTSSPSVAMPGNCCQLRWGALQQQGGGVMTFCSSSMPTLDNVTYSGGQEGVQGGFYGSGGAR